MRVYALIPARSGSKGLPDKNILPVGGHPLLAYAVAFGRQLGVDRVILSTDSEKYAAVAKQYGAECPYLRGERASADTAMEEDILSDLDTNLPKHGIELPDIWVWLKPTSPFRDREAVVAGIRELQARPDLHSVRLVSQADARLHIIGEDGFLKPFLESWDPSRSKMRRNEFPPVYQPFNLEIFRHSGWRERGALFMGQRIRPIVCARLTGLDVDDREGFEIVKALIEVKPRPEIVARHLEL